MKTNIGKNFLQLLVKHFPANSKMHKIFNKNTVKVSYNGFKVWIQSYLDTTITLNSKQNSFGCNCRTKNSCPLNDKCLTLKVIYRADVSNEANNDQKF